MSSDVEINEKRKTHIWFSCATCCIEAVRMNNSAETGRYFEQAKLTAYMYMYSSDFN